jgi:prefoldin alpha subunit
MNEELISRFQYASGHSEELANQQKVVDTQISELTEFRVSLDAFEKSEGGEMLASLGKGVFVKTDIKDKKLFVEVGAGYLVRKTPAEALEIIDGQISRLGEIKMQIDESVESVNAELQGILREAEVLNKKVI